MALSQEDEWKQMVNQDPHSGSVAGDSGHGTVAATGEDEPIDNTKVVGAVVGVNKSVTTEHLSDVKWRDDDPLFMFNDENVIKPQTPAAASMPVQTCEEEDRVVSSLQSPFWKKPCFQESITEQLSKTAPTCLKPNYNVAELVAFTQPSLVNVIPWIKYEAQNMSEPSLRQELQCIKEVKHLKYIIAMIMWF